MPVLKSLPRLSSLVRSLSPCVPIRVMNILSKVPAWVMEPVVTSTSYMASMALKRNTEVLYLLLIFNQNHILIQ